MVQQSHFWAIAKGIGIWTWKSYLHPMFMAALFKSGQDVEAT